MLKVKFLDFDFNKRKNQKYAAENLLFVILRLKSIFKGKFSNSFSSIKKTFAALKTVE